MASGFFQKNEISIYSVLIFFLFTLALISKPDPLAAQEEKLSPEETAAIIHITSQFRFGNDLKVGDWVKYKIMRDQEKAGEIELSVIGEENGAFWIVETFTGPETGTVSETHILTDLAGQNIQQIFTVDKTGEKRDLPVLRIDQYYTIFGEMVEKIQETGKLPPYWWRKSDKVEDIQVAAGSFTCEYLEPDIDDDEEEEDELKEKATSMLGLTNIRRLAEKPEDLSDVLDLKDRVESVTSLNGLKGLVEVPDLDDLDEIVSLLASRSSGEQQQVEPNYYFSENVPRLIPYIVAIRFFIVSEPIKQVSGGLAKFGPIELSSCSGR